MSFIKLSNKQSKNMSLQNLVKSIQNIMRKDAGVNGDAQRIEQLGWIFFLKIFSDKEIESQTLKKNYRPSIPKKYLWQSWASNPEGRTGDELLSFINNDLFPRLKNMSLNIQTNPKGLIIKEVFQDSNNYMKNGTLLRQVINKVNGIDFNKKEDLHIFGDIYENFLKDLQGAGNAGEFYTPRPVTQFMTEMISPQLGEKVLDPACGTGGFLSCATQYIRKHYVETVRDRKTLQKQIHGVEKKPLPHLLCMTNMLLHEIEIPTQIIRGNKLAKRVTEYKVKDRVDVILTNPPFGGSEEEGIKANFPKPFQTSETADLFLVLIINLLKEGGRAGVVLPNGCLSQAGVTARIRQELLETCNLHTIVRLPQGVFSPYSSIHTNLLFFNKGPITKKIWYYELPLPQGLKSYNKGNPIQHKEFEPVKEWFKYRKANKHAWQVSIEEIKKNGYILDIKNPIMDKEEYADPAVLEKEYLLLKKKNKKLLNEIKQKIEKALL